MSPSSPELISNYFSILMEESIDQDMIDHPKAKTVRKRLGSTPSSGIPKKTNWTNIKSQQQRPVRFDSTKRSIKLMSKCCCCLNHLPAELLIYIFDFTCPFFQMLSEYDKTTTCSTCSTHEQVLVRIIPQFFKLHVAPSEREEHWKLRVVNVHNYADKKRKFLIEDLLENSFMNYLLVNKQCFYRVFVTECSENDSVRLFWEFLGISLQNIHAIAETILCQVPFRPKSWLYLFGGTHISKINDHELIEHVIRLQNSSEHFVELYLNGGKFGLNSSIMDNNNNRSWTSHPMLNFSSNEPWRNYLNFLRRKFKKHTQLVQNPNYIFQVNQTVTLLLTTHHKYSNQFVERQYKMIAKKKYETSSSNMERERMCEFLQLLYEEFKVPLSMSLKQVPWDPRSDRFKIQSEILNTTCLAFETTCEHSQTDLFTTLLSSNILHNDSLTLEEKTLHIVALLFSNSGLLTSLFLTFRLEQLFQLLQMVEEHANNVLTKRVNANDSISHLLQHVMKNIKLLVQREDHVIQTLCQVLSKIWKISNIDISLTSCLNVWIQETCFKLDVFEEEEESLKTFILSTFETIFCQLYSFYRPHEIEQAMERTCENGCRRHMGHVLLENALRNANVFEIVLNTSFHQPTLIGHFHHHMKGFKKRERFKSRQHELNLGGINERTGVFAYLIPSCCCSSNNEEKHSGTSDKIIVEKVLSISFKVRGGVTRNYRVINYKITAKEPSMPLEKLLSRMEVLRKYIGQKKCLEMLKNHPSFVASLKLFMRVEEKSNIVKIMVHRLVELLKEWGMEMMEEEELEKQF